MVDVIRLVAFFSASVVLARSFGTAGRGAYALGVTLVAQLSMAFLFGLDVAAVRYIGSRLTSPPYFLRSTRQVRVAACLLTSTISAASALLLVGRNAGIIIFGLSSGLQMLSWTYQGVLRGVGRLVEAAIVPCAKTLLFLITLIPLAATGSFTGVFVVLTVLNLGETASFALLLRLQPRETADRRDAEDITGIYKFALTNHAGSLFQALSYRLDYFVVMSFVGVASLGVYSVAVSLIEAVWLLPNAIAFLFMTTSASGERSELFARRCALTIAAVTASTACVLVSAPVIIRIAFGEQFKDAAALVYFLAPGAIFLALWKNVSNYLVGQGDTAARTISAFLGAAVSAILQPLLVYEFTIKGAAAASSLAYGTSAAYVVIRINRTAGIPLRNLVLPTARDMRSLRRGAQAASTP